MWEYAHTDTIADDYDSYFAYTKLFELDEAVIRRHFTPPGLVADLGCGTARALVPLVRRGFRGLAIDLSEPMLRVVREKAERENLDITCLLANLVELDCVADASVDFCISLFSTLGMIRGRENRQRALVHTRRILKPGGKLVLHVHNFWYNLCDPGGPWWVIKRCLLSAFRRDIEAGDKFFFYRGVNNMFLHVFTYGELSRDLRRAGFRILETVHLDPVRQGKLARPWLFGNLRANGWIVVCA
jgi:SAM-dependent methyltransferase